MKLGHITYSTHYGFSYFKTMFQITLNLGYGMTMTPPTSYMSMSMALSHLGL